MSLRIAFDLDGTVADMSFALRREAEQLFGASESVADSEGPGEGVAEGGDPPDRASELALSARQQIKLWERVRSIENFWTTLPEMEHGIIARIQRTAAARRWEVIFLTTRPQTAGDPTQIQSQRWLVERGFQYPSVFVVQRSRGKVAEALHLDAVVDDRPENCLDVAVDSKAKALLIWRGPPDAVPPGAKRLGVRALPNIGEAVSVLERIDDSRRQPRVVRSIRRMLGGDPEV
jgi:hypothetical protein